jgi:hypothetical protein
MLIFGYARVHVTLRGVMTPVPPLGMLSARTDPADARRDPVRPQTYEITFAGEAGSALRAEFDDCEVTVGPGTTTLRAELPDQAALSGLVLRITGLGLEVVHMQLVPPPGT